MKKVILIVIVIIAGVFVIFNFWAAHQAEKQIDKSLQKQADSTAYSVQYSSIDVRPFAGNISFDDLTVIGNNRIERAKKMLIDLRYIDFLDVYFGGLKYGLRSVTSGQIDMTNFSWISRESTRQISLGNVAINYQGQLWNGLQYVFGEQALIKAQKVTLNGEHLIYRGSGGEVGSIKSDSVFVTIARPKATATGQAARDSIHFEQNTWIPPNQFQQKFAFFIKGFGLKQDSIPISATGFSLYHKNDKNFKISHGRLNTDLFTLNFRGRLVRDSTWSSAQLSPLNITLTKLSKKFKSVLINMQKMLGKETPTVKNQIRFKLTGPLESPHIIPPKSMQ